jgi:hypothetical protein
VIDYAQKEFEDITKEIEQKKTLLVQQKHLEEDQDRDRKRLLQRGGSATFRRTGPADSKQRGFERGTKTGRTEKIEGREGQVGSGES